MSTLSRTVPRQGQEPGTSAGAPCGQRFAHSVASQIRYQEARLEARSSLDLSHILWYRMPASQSGSPTYCAIAHLKFIKNVRGGVVMFFPFPIYQSIYLSQSCLFGKQETEAAAFCWFIAQMSIIARTGPAQSWELRNQSSLSHAWQGSSGLSCGLLRSRVLSHRKLESGARPRLAPGHTSVGCPSSV